MQLKELFQVKSRFYRSVQIELDSSLDDYILTQTGLKIIRRVGESLDSNYVSRSWTITGPYGSGKSAFIVFLKCLLGDRQDPSVVKARDLLKKADKNLYKRLFETSGLLKKTKKGFCHALVSAGRERIELAILKGLRNGLKDFYGDSKAKKSKTIKKIDALIAKSEKGFVPSNDVIIALCDEAAAAVSKSKGAGLLLVIDELGKCLEAAALNSDSDIFILQKLAEAASRSQKRPFLLFTVLHQAFDRYANRLDTEKRNEWSKIQGRFEDVSFVDTNDQIFKLISSAIIRADKNSTFLKSCEGIFDSLAHILKNDHHRSSKAFLDLLGECVPLHPLTAIVLVPLFRSKFSQNERSLFAFLTSTEPGGFSDFLARTSADQKGASLYSLSHLYDYLVSSYGTALFTQNNGKKWIEIENALSRSMDALERKIIKVVGILNLFGESNGFPINDQAIICALASEEHDFGSIEQALKSLTKKSVVTFRKYSNSYVLWGGSDIDIEKKIQDTKLASVTSGSIVEALNRLFPPRPRIAKRYLYEKGTLRYFKVYYGDPNSLSMDLEKPIEDSDGQIILILNTGASTLKAKEIQEKLNQSAVANRTLIGIANHADRFISMFSELLSLQHIRKNTPELQGDPIALREIEARLLQMERSVNESINELFFLSTQKSNPSVWIDSEITKTNISKKDMSMWISDICNRVYPATPVLKNELINRNRMSSTSMSARRILLNAMLENSSQLNLGIKGFPPEFCIYQSVLNASRIHHELSDGTWHFTNVAQDLKTSWRSLWKSVDKFLVDNEERRVGVIELFDLMKKPPFGMKEGVLPVLFMALLKAYDSEIAFFELGTFRPIVKAVDIELLTKVPEKYSVQLCRIVGIKAVVFDQIVSTFVQQPSAKKVNLLQIVKMLCNFMSALPLYVQKTAQLTPQAKAVRKCLLESVEPSSLLYKSLPLACGLEPIKAKGDHSEADAKKFVAELRISLSELQRKEADLFHKIEIILFHTFGMDGYKAEDRQTLSERAKNIISVTMDPVLKAFLVRVTDTLEHKAWLDSVGTVITGRPPLNWSDDDFLSFEHQMASLNQKVSRYERLALEAGKSQKHGGEIRQLTIISNLIPELSKIIHIDQNKIGDLNKLEAQLTKVIEQLANEEGEEIVLAAISNYFIKHLSVDKVKSHNQEEEIDHV